MTVWQIYTLTHDSTWQYNKFIVWHLRVWQIYTLALDSTTNLFFGTWRYNTFILWYLTVRQMYTGMQTRVFWMSGERRETNACAMSWEGFFCNASCRHQPLFKPPHLVDVVAKILCCWLILRLGAMPLSRRSSSNVIIVRECCRTFYVVWSDTLNIHTSRPCLKCNAINLTKWRTHNG